MTSSAGLEGPRPASHWPSATEELAAAHSFPADYVLTGTITDKVRQIGNSVPVETARAICKAIFSK